MIYWITVKDLRRLYAFNALAFAHRTQRTFIYFQIALRFESPNVYQKLKEPMTFH
jgi:hypothetical protein